jgi:PEP-CTERM motif
MSHRPFPRFVFPTRTALATVALMGAVASAQAAIVTLRITAQNLAPANGVAFAPLHVGVGNGSFDAFNNGATAGAAIVSVAEGGSGSAWQPAFAAAEPQAVRGVVGAGGPLLAGATRTLDLTVDTAVNQFFTFAAMVIPSNDHFIGNDNPRAFRIFDAAGNLLLTQISQAANQIWDAGSEITDPAAAAFVGNNSLRTAQNGVVSFNFSELSANNGLTTGAGYVFNNTLQAGTEIYRISLQAVPEPSSVALAALALGLLATARRFSGPSRRATHAV